MSETTDTNEDLTGLKNKVKELIGAVKTANERAERAEREKEEATEAASTANSTELEKMQKRAEKAEREAKAANERADQSDKALRTHRQDAAINDILVSNKVQPDDYRAVKAILKTELDSDSDEPTIGGTPLSEWGKSFFAKEGKRYISAADNNGGGATGSDGAKAARMTKANFNYTDFGKIQLENPAEANAIADAIGKPHLKVPL